MGSTSIFAYIILILSINYAFVYPTVQEISALMDQKQKYEDSLATILNIENKKDELLTKFNNISSSDKKKIETVLPNSLDFVRLISQIDAVSAKYGIGIKNITLKNADLPVGSSITETLPQKTYSSSVVGFSFTASYEKFNSFIADLEKSLRILDIRSLKITSQEDALYSYDIEFETYWLK